jgi:hypothetical protein
MDDPRLLSGGDGMCANQGTALAGMFSTEESWAFCPPKVRKAAPVQQLLSLEAAPFPLSSRPKRTRISYFAQLATTTCAALRKESRMQIIKATGLHRKSGGA